MEATPGNSNISSDLLHYHVQRSDPIMISQHCPERPYLEFRVPERPIMAVRRLIFTTYSHDQGFTNVPELTGTYDRSNTWFSARVITPSGQERVRRRNIQHNVHACLDYRRHENIWDYENADEALQEWLSMIQNGDTIQIIPKAMYAAWVNYVQEVQLDVFVQSVDASSLPSTLSIAEINDFSHYQPLRVEKDEIRVVVLESGADDKPLQLSVQHFSLQEVGSVTYDAVSYCWGEASDMHLISLKQVDDSIIAFSVNSNLFAALKQFRYRSKPRTLWIDLICINQKDLNERGHQVGIMGDIFANAETVLVWLSDANEVVELDMKTYQRIDNQYGETTEHPELFTTHDHVLDKSNNNYPYLEYCQIFRQSWFQRVWVLQEVWRAQRVLVCCGSSTLSLEAIIQANYCINLRRLRDDHTTVLPSIWSILFSLGRSSPIHCTPVPKINILQVVLAGLDLQATDPRDKIFALLGFGTETYQVSTLPAEIRPNYTKSASQVYAEFTRWWIMHYRSLRILSGVHTIHGRTWQDLSSPNETLETEFDLSLPPSWSLWHQGRSEWIHATLGLDDLCPYRATSDHKVDVELIRNLKDPFRLALRGHATGRISSITKMRYPENPSVESRKVYESIFDPGSSMSIWTGSAYHVTHLVDRHNHPIEMVRDHYIAHWGSQRPNYLPCHNESFFKTDNGAEGLCPFGTRVGDVVAVLYGGNVPYILRPKDSSTSTSTDLEEFYFVGECYHGDLMEGQYQCNMENSNIFILV
jgi:hypothetical protein